MTNQTTASGYPERIFLQVTNDDGEPHPDVDDSTWCTDSIHETDVAYIRADLADRSSRLNGGGAESLLKELLEAYEASYPTASVVGTMQDTIKAQNAWGERQGNAVKAAKAFLESAAPQLPAPEGVSEEERADFIDTIEQFGDSGDTTTPYETLMRWANAGLLECEHFTETAAGIKFAAGEPAPLFKVTALATPRPPAAQQAETGLTGKQAWWAGYRAGKGLPPDTPRQEAVNALPKLWLWKNFVDGKPEYWAFDNPFPIGVDHADPQTLGEPCGYAIFKPSRQGRTDVSEEQVLRDIAAVRPAPPVSQQSEHGGQVAGRARKAIQSARQYLVKLGAELPVAVDKELVETFHALSALTQAEATPAPVVQPEPAAFIVRDTEGGSLRDFSTYYEADQFYIENRARMIAPQFLFCYTSPAALKPAEAVQAEGVTDVANIGPVIFSFPTFQHWVNGAQTAWKRAGVSSRNTVCVDQKGRISGWGEHFMAARDDGSFPMDVHWMRKDMAPATPPEQTGGGK